MSLLTIEEFKQFAADYPELADAVHVEEYDTDVYTSTLNLVEILNAQQNAA